MILKFYCIQLEKVFVIPGLPDSVLQQEIDSIKQQFRFNDATLTTAYLNGQLLNSDLTIKELNLVQNQEITLLFSYFEQIKFQLKDDEKQVKKLYINIYNSIQEAENQLAQHFRTDYDVEIILKNQILCKTNSFSLLDYTKVYQFQMKVNLQIKNMDKLYLFRFCVFDKISNIRQKIRKQLQIQGRFQIFQNDRIILDKMENMEETIYSLQIPNYQILTINRLQHMTLSYRFNQCTKQYQIQISQNLEDILNEIRKKHRVLNNAECQIKCNGQVFPELPKDKDKEYLMENIVEVEENKDESAIITIINYFNMTNREVKVVNIKQNLGVLKNIIKNQNYKCINVEFLFHDNQQLDIDNKTFQQLGFEANKHYLLQYKLINDNKKSPRNRVKQQQKEQLKKNIFGYDKKQDSAIILHNSIYSQPYFTEKPFLTESEFFKEECKTENTNIIIVKVICNQENQDFQIPSQVLIDENMIVSQSIIYKAISQYRETLILKYKDRIVEVYKSFKDLGISNENVIEVVLLSNYQKQLFLQAEEEENNANVILHFQFNKDGIQRKEKKKYNLFTLKFSLIKKALLAEYQLPDNYEIMYNGNRVNLNSNIQGVLQEGEYLFILEEQVISKDKKLVTLSLKMIPDGSPQNQSIQVEKELELSILYHLVKQKLKQQNFTLFYDGQVIKNQKETFIELKDDREEEVEILVEDNIPSSFLL